VLAELFTSSWMAFVPLGAIHYQSNATINPPNQLCTESAQSAALMEDFEFLQPHPTKDFEWIRANLGNCSHPLVRALAWLHRHSDDLHSPKGVFQAGVFTFLKSRIRTIRFENEETAHICLNPGIAAFVDVKIPNTIRVCPSYSELESTLVLAQLLLHEARHVDGHPHVLCAQGEFANGWVHACDEKIEDQGSYAIGAEFLKIVIQSEGLPETVRNEARGLLFADLISRFNQLPYGLKRGALLKAKTGSAFFYDGKQRIEISAAGGRSLQSSLLISRSGQPTLFEKETGAVSTLHIGSVWLDTLGDFADLFRKNFQINPWSKLLDVYYGKSYACFLFASKLHCGKHGEPDKSFALKSMKAQSFLHTENSKLLKRGEIYLADGSKKVIALPKAFGLLGSIRDSNWQKDYLPQSAIGYFVLNPSKELLLRADGRLMSYDFSKRKWAEEGEQLGFESLTGPIFWTEESLLQ